MLTKGEEIYINSIGELNWSNNDKAFKSILPKDSIECRYLQRVGDAIYAFLENFTASEWQLLKLEQGTAEVIRTFDTSLPNKRIYTMKKFGDGFMIKKQARRIFFQWLEIFAA
ncbi:MAG: hypothetical protein AAF806_02315 [Bacteroidota bacterium]